MPKTPNPERQGLSLDSWLIAGGRPHQPGHPLNVPIVTASNFEFGGDRIYAREDGTETVAALEELLGGMEAGTAVAFASGMAAVAAVFHAMPTGARIALPDDCYHGVAELAAEGASRASWQVTRLAVEDTVGWQAAVSNSDLVWLESPSNPLLAVADLTPICSVERPANTLVCVDSTFATPLLHRPLEFGADVVMHSTTKFIGGHSDLLGGALVARDPSIAEKLRKVRTLTGATPGALETFLTIRGCRTLAVRLERGQANAVELAKRLELHPQVSTVRYPGLASHPTHEVAARVLAGFGAMISFDLKGTAERADRLCQTLRLIRHATSLGGVESTIERRAAVPGQEHLPATLLRLSVGCESLGDLWADLEQALG